MFSETGATTTMANGNGNSRVPDSFDMISEKLKK